MLLGRVSKQDQHQAGIREYIVHAGLSRGIRDTECCIAVANQNVRSVGYWVCIIFVLP